jgi:alpha-galactosidase
MISIQSPHLRLDFYPETGTFSYQNLSSEHVSVEQVTLGLVYRIRHFKVQTSAADWGLKEVDLPVCLPAHGLAETLTLQGNADLHGLAVQVQFALLKQVPMLLWRMKVVHQGNKPVQVLRLDMLRSSGRGQPCSQLNLGGGNRPEDFGFFCNGWQSWAFSATYGANEPIRRTRLSVFQTPLYANPGTPQTIRAGEFTSDFFSVIGNRATRKGLVVGFLSQREHFGTIEASLKPDACLELWANGDSARLDPGREMVTDWAVLYGFDIDATDALGVYLDAVAREYAIKPGKDIPVGWCSWYQYYTNISASIIRENLHVIDRNRENLPINLVQIDDGFETYAGDWFNFKPEFPEGLASLSGEIKDRGFTPGLWLAPFIVHPEARLNKEHPEYLLRNALGRPVNAGFVWNRFCTALDLTQPGALDYACRVVNTAASQWGFPYLKLDFLYAAAVNGQFHDPTRTRAQVLRSGMEALRRAAGDEAYLLGCGAPLGSAIGLFDAMRIGADTNGNWNGKYLGTEFIFNNEPHIPSARNAIQNVITRAPMHNRWWVNDPDCLLVSPDFNLSLAEIESFATAAALTGGSLLLSDRLESLPAHRLWIAESMLPLIGKRCEVIDWFDRVTPRLLRLDLQGACGEWSLAACFNWDDRAVVQALTPDLFCMPAGEYQARSFWDGCAAKMSGVTPFHTLIQAHGVSLMALRRLEQTVYLGSDMHVSQGLEVMDWFTDDKLLRIQLEINRMADGVIDLKLPGQPVSAVVGDQPCEWQSVGDGMWRFGVHIDRSAVFSVQWA